ncbi:MAG: aminotransferase class I/II-fold pyridoxal phosphate-dependent enzyme [Candidatus Acidiferrales bacterium]
MPSEFHRLFHVELESGLRALETKSQRRTLAELQGVNLCSNDYLGLAGHPALHAAVVKTVEEAARVGGTGSRLLSGHAKVWSELEERFAHFAGTEAALYFGSGYAANLGLLTSLVGKADLVFSDASNHASIIDGIRLAGARKVIYPHLDLDALESRLSEHRHERCRKLIVTESVFSMEGDVANVAALLGLAERYGAGLIVDEAHATAVHGPGGRGIVAAVEATCEVVASVHTCSKALASAGAFVCGNSVLREHLINHARTFLFTTAMPPYMAGQIRAALKLAQGMDAQRADLQAMSAQFCDSIRAQGWDTAGSTTQIVPALIGANAEALRAAEFLQREGFAVRAIRPPTVPEGSARLRFSLTRTITLDEIARLERSLEVWRAQSHVPGRATVAATASAGSA